MAARGRHTLVSASPVADAQSLLTAIIHELELDVDHVLLSLMNLRKWLVSRVTLISLTCQMDENVEPTDLRIKYLDSCFPLLTASGEPYTWGKYARPYEYTYGASEAPRFSFQPHALLSEKDLDKFYEK